MRAATNGSASAPMARWKWASAITRSRPGRSGVRRGTGVGRALQPAEACASRRVGQGSIRRLFPGRRHCDCSERGAGESAGADHQDLCAAGSCGSKLSGPLAAAELLGPEAYAAIAEAAEAQGARIMPFIPHTEQDVTEMLAAMARRTSSRCSRKSLPSCASVRSPACPRD